MIFSPVFKRLSLYTFFLLVASAALFPSEGSRGLLNPKAIAFVLFSFSFAAFLLTERKIKSSEIFPLCGLCLFLSAVAAWVCIGLSRESIDPYSVLDETKLILITFIPFIGALILSSRGILHFSSLLKVLIYTNATYSIAKMCLLFLLFLKVITFKMFLEMTGMRVMSLDVAGSFNRFLTSCDIFTPFLLFFVAARDRFGLKLPRLVVLLYIPLSILSIVIAFSRVFIFIGAVALLLGVLLEFQKKAVACFYATIFLLAGTVTVIGPEKVAAMIELRLFSQNNDASDAVRKTQIDALWEEVVEHPLIGIGMGGYSHKVTRDKEVRHLYEVQWLALLAQFGFLGIIPLLGPIFALFFYFLAAPLTVERLLLFCLFLGWISSGATNPFVLSLASGVMYTLFALALKEIETDHPRHPRKIVSTAS